MTVSIRRVESQIQLSEVGVRYRRAWLPPTPEKTMILVHGYAEHSGRYDEMAMHFAKRGFAVHAYDQSGHGRTAGPRGDVDRYDRLIDELARFVEIVAAEHPGLSITLVGHSMGGLVAAATVAFCSPPIDRLVLSAALLELGGDRPGSRQLLARLLAPFGSWAGLTVGLDPTGLSRDPEVGRRYLADPFVRDRMSARFAAGMMSTLRRLRDAVERIDRPALILHGEVDPICPVAGSRTFYAGLSPATASLSRLLVYPELRHEIFQEPERHQVWQDMLDWMAV